MKKIIVSILLIAAITAAMAGCSSTDSSAGENIEKSTAAPVTEVTTLSENQTQIAGTVTSIIGNEVVLALGEINERSGSPSENSGADSSADSNTVQGNKGQEDFSGKMPEGEMPNGERPFGGGMPNGDMPSGERPSGNFGDMGGAKVQITSTGETGTYLIPVGLTLTGLSGSVSDFSAISAGMTLRLTTETGSNDTQSIVAVEVLSQ